MKRLTPSLYCLFALGVITLSVHAVTPPGCVVTFGSVAPPPRITNAVAVSVKTSVGHGLALLSNGTVIGWGNNSSGQAIPPSSVTNVVGIAAGAFHSVALRADGTVVCWGTQSTPPGLSNVVAVSAGFNHSLALLADGTVRGWGSVPGLELSNIVAIASGIGNNLAVRQDGTVVAWGGVNQSGQNTVPTNLSHVVAIAGGRTHSLALKSNGTVVNWGNAGVGVLPEGLSNIVSIAAGNTSLAIGSNHTMVRWAYNFTNRVAIPLQQTNFVAAAAGDDAYVAITLQPVIVTNIAGFTANAGQNRTLSLSAISSTPMVYQWRHDGANIGGATNSLLSFTNLQSPDAGNYDVVVSNSGGSITSSVAAVVVNPAAPSILTNPVSQIVLAGSTVSYNVSASGSLPLSFQWWYNAVELLGQLNPHSPFPTLELSRRRYQVSVTNAYGSNFSANATLTVNNPPAISNSVTTIVVPAGTNLVLHGSATGNQPLSYQWQFQGTNILAATNLGLALTDVQAGMAGTYSLVASNAFGRVTNQLYSIGVVDSPPIIYQQPASQNCSLSNVVTLRVIAVGSAPVAYQWHHNGAPVSGATNPQLQIQNFQATDAGTYFVSISNAFGLTNSAPATLTVGEPYPGQTDLPSLGFTQVISNSFKSPVGITSARDGSGRLFVVEQAGRILIVQSNALFLTPFLEISNRVVRGFEQGLLGLAFPPGFATHGHFYVNYTRAPDGATAISRFSVNPTNANVAVESSEQILKIIPQPYANHNGGQLAFGPDGYLYIGMGDGGYPFDSYLAADPLNNAQNPASLLGKMLRIDVESGASPYAVPVSNPFVSNTNFAPEIWALGLRNPWRFSFDRLTGDLYIGDVGQSSFEEINFQAAGSTGGQNYGWRYREGPSSYWDINKDPSGFSIPLTWYNRSVGGSVTGGFVYRGPHEPRMDGVYFYGDFLSGRIWALTRSNTNWATSELVRTGYHISTFGEDEQGRLFLADYNTGNVWQLTDTRNALPPTLRPGKGPFTNTQNIVVSCPTPGATIRYTTDGRDPNEFDPGIASGSAIFVDESVTLKVRAFRDNLFPSAVVSTNLSFEVATPVFSPPISWYYPTPVTNGTLVTIRSDTPGATIHFTLDGQDADQWSPVYEGPFVVEPVKSVRARAFKQGYSSSPMASGTFTWLKAPTPQIDPPFGHVAAGAKATLSCEIPDAELRYTTNGTDPTLSSLLYTEPFPIAAAMNVRARAWVPNYDPSDIMNMTFAPALTIQSLSFSGEQPQITWIAAPGVWYLIQSSEDLKAWTDLEYVSWPGGYIIFTDSRTVRESAQRFYRVVAVPSGPP